MFVSLLKELNLVSLSKVLLKKILFIILLAGYSTAQALTLGEFSVESFLDKPLSAEIIANANSGDNLDSLEVTMANEEEFEQAGIVRSDSLDSFQFELVKVSDEVTRIVVTTEEEISDPYIHMLLKVRWNGGQLLREFTALIDPPLYSSQPVDSVESAVTTTQEIGSSASEQAELSSGTYSDGVYGPVEAGQTLSEIAEEIQESYPDLSIYQIMYVLYQDNKAAFIGENINNLAKDSTLVFDSLDSQQQDIVGRQEGINFFYSQLAEWSASQGTETSTANNESTSSNESVSTEDSSSESTQAAAESSAVDQVDQSVPEDSSQTEESTASTNEPASSAPEFQVASSDIETGAQDSGDVNNQLVSDLEAQVAELEASVESAKLENEELKDTISILETQLADSNRLIELNNQELASLAAQNEANQNQASEVSNTVESEAAKSEPEPVESEPEPAPAEEENLSPVPEASVSIVDKIISFLQGAWRYILILLLGILAIVFLKLRSSKKDEDAIEAFETTFTVYPEDTGDVNVDGEGDINSPESEAKAEELINNIKSEKTKAPEEIANLVDETSESTVMSKLDMDALREATQSVDETVETGEITKESSFLTVYNDGDVIVNADEIDPIAESEVYIAYGREDQGEEVLVDGIKNFPDRNDIKIALLSLYAKSNKQEKFDGVYQTLIDNGVENNAEEWTTVSDLKNTMDVKNGVSPAPVAESADNLGVDNEATNSEFIVDTEVNDLSEIDIKSETFEISEIDFNSENDDSPTIKADEVNSGSIGDEISIDIHTESNEIDSNTIEVESFTMEVDDSPMDDLERTIDAAIQEITEEVENSEQTITNEITSDIDDFDFETNSGDIEQVEQEISQIDFTEEVIETNENSIEIDLESHSPLPDESTDAIDIEAEISEISYDDEVSLTDVMELNVNDVDLNSIPQEQDLTPVLNNSATTLINEVDYVEDDTIQNEVTVDLTESMEFVDDDESLDIDLDLGEVQNKSEDMLPDGESDPETQLDLAKVFLELDDVSGAVKILKELVDNDKVGEEAKELLAKHS